MPEMNWGELAKEYWHVGLVAAFLLGLTVDFLIRFFIRSFALRRELAEAIDALRAIRKEKKGELVELSLVASKAMKSKALSNLWLEYAKTLHKQLARKMRRASAASSAGDQRLWLKPSSPTKRSSTVG